MWAFQCVPLMLEAADYIDELEQKIQQYEDAMLDARFERDTRD